MKGYYRRVVYSFEVRSYPKQKYGVWYTIANQGDDVWTIEEERKDGQEDTHFCVDVVSVDGKWIIAPDDLRYACGHDAIQKHLDTYGVPVDKG